MHAETLLDLCGKIGISAPEVKGAETVREFNLTEDLHARDLKRIGAADIESLMGTCGNALSLRVGYPDGPRLLDIRSGEVIGELASAWQEISKCEDALELRLELLIDKTVILSEYDLPTPSVHALFYLFKENLYKLLRSPLPWLDTNLFVGRLTATVIIVSDADLDYVGRFLTIVGEKEDGWTINDMALPSRRSLEARICHYHKMASENLSWGGFQLKHVTPLHFLCERSSHEGDDLESILADHALHACIVYTANRSSYSDGRFQAFYAGSEHESKMSLRRGGVTKDTYDLLPRFALWPYGGQETDRLTILQNVVARELEEETAKDNYDAFVRRLPHLFTEVRWHHRVFVDGKIDRHFQQVDKVTDYVAEVAKEVSESIDAVTKGLTDALLGAVGVVVVTLLATLIKELGKETVISMALWAYAAYLLIFQGIYRMSSIAHSYLLLQDETERRLSRYAEQLGRKKVKSMSSPLEARKRQFWVWFVTTCVFYLIVCVVFVILGSDPLGNLARLGVVVPTATSTPSLLPTVTPTP